MQEQRALTLKAEKEGLGILKGLSKNLKSSWSGKNSGQRACGQVVLPLYGSVSVCFLYKDVVKKFLCKVSKFLAGVTCPRRVNGKLAYPQGWISGKDDLKLLWRLWVQHWLWGHKGPGSWVLLLRKGTRQEVCTRGLSLRSSGQMVPRYCSDSVGLQACRIQCLDTTTTAW